MSSKRGTIEIEAEGELYRLRFTTNAMARYQDRAGETVTQAFRALDAGGQSEDLDAIRLRRLFWAALSSEHEVSEEEAGDVMDALGIQMAAQRLGEAIRAAFPEASSGNVGAPSKKAARPKPTAT